MPETLAGYMGGRYVRINNVLRGVQPGATKAARVATYNTMLNDIVPVEGELGRLPRAAQGMIVYRRCGPIDHVRTVTGVAYQNGETFRDPAFLSTSANVAYKTAQGQFQLVMMLTCAATSRGHNVMAIRGIVGEAEILFERGTRFLIKSTRSLGNNNVLWEMTELTGT